MIFQVLRVFLVYIVICFFISCIEVNAQVTIVVSQIPASTPPDDTIYVAGTFNNWSTADPKYRLTKRSDSTYTITFYPTDKYFEYKFTRGSWETVEGDQDGRALGNRVFFYKDSAARIDAVIKTWEDQEKMTIRVSRLPVNSTPDAELYITGAFNSWNPADQKYKFQRMPDGSYALTLPSDVDSLHYKFTRGSWSSMESDAYGNPIETRKLVRFKGTTQDIYTEILGWEDLSGKPVDFYTLILAIGAILSFFVAIALTLVRYGKKAANNFLKLSLILVSLMLLVKCLLNNQFIFYAVPKLALLQVVMLFVFIPLVYLHGRKLTLPHLIISVREQIYYLLPLLLVAIALIPIVTLDNSQFISRLLNNDLNFFLTVIGALGLAINIWYVLKMVRLLSSTNIQSKGVSEEVARSMQPYITSLTILVSIILAVLVITFLVALFFQLFGSGALDRMWVMDKGISLAWIGISIYPFVITYFCIVQPENFRLAVDPDKGKHKDISTSLKKQLSTFMVKNKPFLNPDLSIQDLAGYLQTNTHTLSRIINEGYSKNFYDFINEYRIAEFKIRVAKGDHKKQTFLSIAFEVGFNSKTTFNRTFKKITGKTPREYLQSLNDPGSLEDLAIEHS